MYCPFCESSQLTVLNSRPTNFSTRIWRRRKCMKCGDIFTTYESIKLDYLTVVKKSGKRQKYERAKIFSGIFKSAIEGKDVDKGDMSIFSEKITRLVEQELLLKRKKLIKSRVILESILKHLSKKEPQVFLRFLAFKEGNSEKSMKKYIVKYFKN